VHDLKHTCGRRAAGVGLEDRRDILDHKSGRITTHYSAPEIGSLVAAVNRIADSRGINENRSTVSSVMCKSLKENWWKGSDSNPRPRHYECRAEGSGSRRLAVGT
jgi:hypothetical protein